MDRLKFVNWKTKQRLGVKGLSFKVSLEIAQTILGKDACYVGNISND